ncbi:DUF6953 family protein [Qipengyuania sediminis]|uniref:DUF6953 family protein n=1 Tax=Qipengyuania sediminis TaxID=1532023 RepID=UPI001059C35E|nr:hypothetical protein [Qipengyuania sediminis]
MDAKEIAQWMLDHLAQMYLYQSTVATHVRKVNPDLTYRNPNGNWALHKSVLDAFRKLTPGDEIVWERSSQLWRHRKPRDKPGRMQS